MHVSESTEWILYALLCAGLPLVALSKKYLSVALYLLFGLAILAELFALKTVPWFLRPFLIALDAGVIYYATQAVCRRFQAPFSNRLAVFVFLLYPIHAYRERFLSGLIICLISYPVIYSAFWFYERFKTQKYNLVYLAVIFLGSFAMPLLYFTQSAYHHWSFYMGPMEAVRAGGKLLASVPSQYGFLSILLPNALPFSALTAFTLVFGVLLIAQFLLTFYCVNNYVLAFFLTYLMAGFRGDGLGAWATPSASAYRFLWGYALAILLTTKKAGRWIIPILVVGCLWSVESAFYCIATVLAAGPKHLKQLLIGAGISAAVLFLYQPDFYSFVEFALTYKSGMGALPIEFSGELVSALAVLGLVAYLSEGNFATLGFLLAIASYFISRSHVSNLFNLFALAIPLVWLRLPKHENLRPVQGILILLVVAACFGSFPSMVRGILSPRSQSSIIHATATDAAYINDEFNKEELLTSPLFPIHPAKMYVILSPERQLEYLERFWKDKSLPQRVCWTREKDSEIHVESFLSAYYRSERQSDCYILK